MVGAAFGVGPNGGYMLMVLTVLGAVVLLMVLGHRPPPIFRPPKPDEMSEAELDLHHLTGKVLTKEAELSYLKRELSDKRRALEFRPPVGDEDND